MASSSLRRWPTDVIPRSFRSSTVKCSSRLSSASVSKPGSSMVSNGMAVRIASCSRAAARSLSAARRASSTERNGYRSCTRDARHRLSTQRRDGRLKNGSLLRCIAERKAASGMDKPTPPLVSGLTGDATAKLDLTS